MGRLGQHGPVLPDRRHSGRVTWTIVDEVSILWAEHRGSAFPDDLHWVDDTKAENAADWPWPQPVERSRSIILRKPDQPTGW